ncbi:MAG: OadG family protein [Veillonellaceae bacterium]|jgi:Na+-transporting methylmalonyl-CoA/oxaloacetate decarboxylase gamma subunit|nr:OadG family protein [Veillonellaceae bacterium]
MGQPLTTDPIIISVINITVVFAVLYGLSLIIRLIQYIDPTRKKQNQDETAIQAALEEKTEPEEDQAQPQAQEKLDELIIVFTAALAAYSQSEVRIVSIRPISGSNWSQTARMEAISGRARM